MDCILGEGTIGKTLASQMHKPFEQWSHQALIDARYSLDKQYDTVYIACVPAKKWLANQQPEHDTKQIQQIASMACAIKCNTLVLISTIDAEQPVDTYGMNRLWLEEEMSKTHRAEHVLIVRLPMLIGQYVQKNVYYDILHPKIEPEKLSGLYKERYEWIRQHDDEPIVMAELTDPEQVFVIVFLGGLLAEIEDAISKLTQDVQLIRLYQVEKTSVEIAKSYCTMTAAEISRWRTRWRDARKQKQTCFEKEKRQYRLE